MNRPNRLASETSPYLLQHAHNPVDWFAWGEEALQTARREDKPILVSIGYAACHWCHVMEKESFEDAETARFMNERFINIKIDREERPDLDHIYMDAVQAMTGSGGWPLNVFLTPEAKPFYGGTYFPPRPVYNRSSWREVLAGVSAAFSDRRAEVEQQADNLTRHVATAGGFGIGEGKEGGDPVFRPETLRQMTDQLLGSADKEEGGFGAAPKFPQTFSLRFLLHYYYFTREIAALDQVCLSLDKMIRGGIYDQLGGGFARYSTDREWLVPHFEKMLYDNALLVITLCEAYQLLKKPLYKEAIQETIAFTARELSNAEGGFYSSLDADSEGIEGKYYIWDKAEIDLILGKDAALFCAFYGVTDGGNWEGANILTRAEGKSLTADEERTLKAARLRLLEHRNSRVRPALDDKILLGWNALM
ncbi:MAG TPA: thioredoxin domain-containing protein, partial [Puia sp.]|nr:thioredoxin domain-containing protein [Puia sp.]